tara:strand:- start:16666 stop:17145 length:480 start_codon:yes stop_codon:yes gene_type:complete
MSKKTKSAIDSIYDIEEKLEAFDNRFASIESQLKIISSKLEKAIKSKTPDVKPIEGGMPSAKPPVASAKSTKKIEKLVLGSTKTFGYIVNKNQQPIKGVEVNVYDGDNDVIKKITTNDDGYWSARLPSGKFGIEYIHKKFKPINRTILIPENVTEFEVR